MTPTEIDGIYAVLVDDEKIGYVLRDVDDDGNELDEFYGLDLRLNKVGGQPPLDTPQQAAQAVLAHHLGWARRYHPVNGTSGRATEGHRDAPGRDPS